MYFPYRDEELEPTRPSIPVSILPVVVPPPAPLPSSIVYEEEEDFEPTQPSIRSPVPAPPEQELQSRSSDRYRARLPKFQGETWPRLTHYMLWLLHNCVVHPLLALFPRQKLFQVHELTSCWLENEKFSQVVGNRIRQVHVPEITSRWKWIKHNLIAHMAIGLLPCEWTFAYHDRTAADMNVIGWV